MSIWQCDIYFCLMVDLLHAILFTTDHITGKQLRLTWTQCDNACETYWTYWTYWIYIYIYMDTILHPFVLYLSIPYGYDNVFFILGPQGSQLHWGSMRLYLIWYFHFGEWHVFLSWARRQVVWRKYIKHEVTIKHRSINMYKILHKCRILIMQALIKA